jgi:flavin-dependent dehydrogenase
MRPAYDVVILGGGLAGLTLAIQIKRARPETAILVAERRAHPAPEAAFKVGESSVEIGAHYFSRVIGMLEHIEQYQLPKLGLRFFFPAGDNQRIEERVEFGPHSFPGGKVFSYQLDRGRFENALAEEAQRLGVDVLDACKAHDIAFGEPAHSVTLLRHEQALQVQARWVVDASGRNSFLKRRLDLYEDNNHGANAVWFRVAEELDIQAWSDDPEWQARVPSGQRRLSTNHLMGPGYWVWLIPLGSGSTSVGIVADDVLHPFETINRFERALDWLYRHEPQCAAVVEASRDKLQDFKVLKHFSHSCKQVFSRERWCITGEAGCFLDPFYSPGSDFIAMSNTLVTELVTAELAGESIDERVALFEQLYLQLYRQSLLIYEGQYPLMGNAQVMQAKVVWDSVVYGALNIFLYFNNKLTDALLIPRIMPLLERFYALDKRVQGFFHEWDALDRRPWTNSFLAIQDLDLMAPFVRALSGGAERSNDELYAALAANLKVCERVAVAFFHKAAALLAQAPLEAALHPYAIGLDPARWEADGLLCGEPHYAPEEAHVPGLERIWVDEHACVGARG